MTAMGRTEPPGPSAFRQRAYVRFWRLADTEPRDTLGTLQSPARSGYCQVMNGRSGSRLTQQRSRRLREAYRSGDMAEVKAVLGWPEAFPNSPQPMDLAAGDW